MMSSPNPPPANAPQNDAEQKISRMLLFTALHHVRAYFVRGVQVFSCSPLEGILCNSIANPSRCVFSRSTVSQLVCVDVAPLRRFWSYVFFGATVSQLERINFSPLRQFVILFIGYAPNQSHILYWVRP